MKLDFFKVWRIVAGILPFALAIFGIDDRSVSAAIMIVYGSASLLSFAVYGIDKWLSVKEGHRRVPENTLHFFTLMGGWPGSLMGQVIFKHKTQKKPFVYILYSIVLFHILGWLIYLSSFRSA
ncbi:MAG: DUF1294 domain-containing protein [Candidatus Delongbacteria bacterium]|nr:DUF1294 domain-containing protein [Candidatus Delongbacteria bacterium]MDD4206168.1 DUF1294 domain-containing protein [Candidatus Delongbacteria bacterium]